MATFANHSSNLRGLNSALHLYTDVLGLNKEKTQDQAQDHKDASSFLEEQRKRIDSIDLCLLQATEDLLPASQDAKTITELAELCRQVQEATRQKMSLLRTRLELLGVKAAWGETVNSPMAAAQEESNSQIYWAIGEPLECVVEGDVETEGATTPGSWLQPSPFASAGKNRTSLTPTTPTMERFTFSANTTSILEKMNLNKPSSIEKRRSSSKGKRQSPAACGRRLSSGKQVNLDGFQSDDDMISLATAEDAQSTFIKSKSINMIKSSPRIHRSEDRSQFLARMESMLERVEEELIHENRPSDETSGLSRSTNASRNQRRPSNNKFLEELQEEEETVDDDSTNVVATQVASVSDPKKLVPFGLVKPAAVHCRPTQIVVDTGIASPAHTNITFDVTMMNDTMASMSILAEDDNMSTVTPILDRYRLDPDDNSIGIKVVPNQRGSHKHHNIKLGAVSEIETEMTAKLTPEYVSDKDGFMSPRGLPGSVSARKKQYRKTPFPKKQLEQSFESIESENEHPNLQRMFSPTSSVSLGDSSLSIPPLRPKSFGPMTTSTRKVMSRSKTMSLPAGDRRDGSI